MVSIRENGPFHGAKTDYSLKTDYSWVRLETELFLQQAPVNSSIVTPLATTTAASEPAGVLERRRPAPRRQHLEVGLGLCRTVCPHCVEHGPTVDRQLSQGAVPGQQAPRRQRGPPGSRGALLCCRSGRSRTNLGKCSIVPSLISILFR